VKTEPELIEFIVMNHKNGEAIANSDALLNLWLEALEREERIAINASASRSGITEVLQ
jgi:hypothetical protein